MVEPLERAPALDLDVGWDVGWASEWSWVPVWAPFGDPVSPRRWRAVPGRSDPGSPTDPSIPVALSPPSASTLHAHPKTTGCADPLSTRLLPAPSRRFVETHRWTSGREASPRVAGHRGRCMGRASRMHIRLAVAMPGSSHRPWIRMGIRMGIRAGASPPHRPRVRIAGCRVHRSSVSPARRHPGHACALVAFHGHLRHPARRPATPAIDRPGQSDGVRSARLRWPMTRSRMSPPCPTPGAVRRPNTALRPDVGPRHIPDPTPPRSPRATMPTRRHAPSSPLQKPTRRGGERR